MARSFNGSSDKILTSNFTAPAGGTLSAWLNPGSLSNAYNGIVGQSASASAFFIILLKSTGKFAYYMASAATVSIDPGTATASGWTHVAMTYSQAAGMATFVNGASDGTAAASGTINSMTVGMSVGFDSFNAGRNFPGSMADAAEWNVVLTAAEIGALAKGARPYQIRPSALLSYLPLDGLSSPEPDLSGNAANGTVTGTALSFGPPFMQFTPRWPIPPIRIPSVVAGGFINPDIVRANMRVFEGYAT